MTFNVHQGFDNAGVVDADAFERVLREEAPDVVVLQESDTLRVTSANLDVVAVLAARLGYHEAYGPPTREESFGVSVLSRHPIVSWQAVELPAKKDNRFLVQATLDVRGRNVTVLAVHLGLPQDEREAQIREVLARVASAPGPVVLAGDFNSCPFRVCPDYDGPNDTVYQETARVLRDGYLVAGGADPDAPEAWTFDAASLTHRIDYVFVDSAWDVAAYRSVRTPAALAASDHVPVVAELRLR
jgi:endonuclease/exonuclease/phosphatase family metal-dependent hydrolase